MNLNGQEQPNDLEEEMSLTTITYFTGHRDLRYDIVIKAKILLVQKQAHIDQQRKTEIQKQTHTFGEI